MDFEYSAFDGQQYLSPDQLFPEPKVMRFIMQFGDEALEAMESLEGEEEQQYIQQMIDSGLLEEYEDEQGNRRLRLTPKMLKGLQHKSLEEMFNHMRKGTRESHRTAEHGRSQERSEGNRPYQFGDSMSEIDLGATMRNAIHRQVAERAEAAQRAEPSPRAGPSPAMSTSTSNPTSPPQLTPSLPVGITPNDFDLHNTEGSADCATVMLMDLSGSMMRYGRFYQAKRVAMGMQALVNQRFPQDTLEYAAFYTLADKVLERDVPLVMPKPVNLHDPMVRLRIPLEQAEQHQDELPLHFTNLQLGLRKARQMLSRSGAANKQIFIITDGQPTAHVEPNSAGEGEMLYLLYPPQEQTATATLKEAMRCQQQGIRLTSFALIEDYWAMDWVGFIEQMTRLTRGIAYYCTSDDLSSTVVESYLTGRKQKSFIH